MKARRHPGHKSFTGQRLGGRSWLGGVPRARCWLPRPPLLLCDGNFISNFIPLIPDDQGPVMFLDSEGEGHIRAGSFTGYNVAMPVEFLVRMQEARASAP